MKQKRVLLAPATQSPKRALIQAAVEKIAVERERSEAERKAAVRKAKVSPPSSSAQQD